MDDNNQRLLAELQKQNAELQRQMAALQRSHHLLQAVVEGTTDAVFVKDLQGRYLMANAAVTNFVGKSVEEVLGHDDTQLFSAETARQIMERDRRIIESGQTQTDEEVGTAAGQTRTYLATKGPYRDEHGHVIGLIGISRDITERLRLEQQLTERETRLRAILDTEPECVKLLGPNCTLLDMNPAGLRIIEADSLEQVLGASLLSLVEPKYRQAFAELSERVFQGESGTLEFEIQGLRGSRCWLETHAAPYRDAAGQIISVLGITRDITKRRQAEELLATSEARFRAIVERSGDAFFLMDANGAVTYSSPATDQNLGYPEAEIQGRNAFELVHPDAQSELRGLMARLVQEPDSEVHCQFQGLHRNGTWRWIDAIGRNRLADPNLHSIAVTYRDITERKRGEEKLREQEQLLQLFVEHSPAAIAMFDGEMRYLVTSPRWLTDFALAPQDLTGQCHYDVFPDISEHWKQVHRRCLQGATEKCDEEAFVHADGHTDWVRWEILPWHTADGNIGGILIFSEVITARKLAEDALREKELLLSESQRIAHIGSWTAELSTGRVIWTDETYRIWGRSHDTFTPRMESFLDLIHPDDRPAMQSWITDCLAERRPGELEFRTILPDGTIRFLSGRGELGYDAEHQPSFMTGTVQDITEQKQSEQALRESEGRLHLLVQASNVGLWDWNLNTNEVFFSPEWKRQLGYSDDEVPNRFEEWERRTHPEDLARTMAAVSDFHEGRRDNHDVEFRMRHKDGSWRWILARADLVHDADGRAIRMMGCHIDITDRKRASVALQESERFAHGTLDALTANIAILDETGVILSVNRAWREFAAQNSAGVAGVCEGTNYLHVCESASGTDRETGDAFGAGIRSVMQGIHKEFLLEYPCHSPTENRWFVGRVTRFQEQGPTRIVVSHTNVTEIKQSEALINGQKHVLEAIATGAPLGESLSLLLRVIEEQSAEMICSILLLDADGRRLTHGAGPSLPVEYCRAIDGVVIGPAVGSCGTAAFRAEPVIVEDIATDPLWTNFRDLALHHGLRACWSVPIWDASRAVLGTFAIYYRKPALPTERHQRLVLIATQIAAIAIAKHQEDYALNEAKRTLLASQQRFATIFRSSPVGICVTRLSDGTFLDANDAFLTTIGYSREDVIGRSSLDPAFNYWLEPDDRRWLVETLLVTGSIRNCELGFRRRDGTIGDSLRSLERITLDGEDCILTILEDITERKQMEIALRDSEARLVAAEVRAGMGSWELDLATQTGWWSPGMFRLLGRDSTLGPPTLAEFFELIHPDDRQGTLDSISLMGEPSQNSVGDYRFRATDGTVRHFSCHINCLRDSQGQTVRLAGSLQDITAGKQAEAALAAERLLLRTMADNLPAFVFMKDIAGRYVFVNRTHARQLGLNSEAEMLGKTVFDMFPGDIARSFDADDQVVIRTGQPVIEREELFVINGTAGWFLTTKVPLRDAQGQITGLLGIALDISARKQAEAALVAERNLLRTLIDHIPDLIFVKDTESRQLLNNAANLRLVGGEKDTEVVGKTVFDFYPHEQAQRYFDEDQRVMRSGQAQLNQEESVLDRNGQEHWLLSSKVPLRDIDGKCIGLVGIKRDITEHRQANLELAASRERLEVLSRQLIATQESERRHLARELHDEIGQALTGIKMNLKTLQQPMSNPEPATPVTEAIAIVDQTLQQVRSLALELRPSMLDDIGIVAALRWCLDRQSRQAGFAATIHAESSVGQLPPEISIACFRVAQESFTNIARHAHARHVRVEIRQLAEELELLVCDDGVGFDVPAARRRATRGESIGLLGMEERIQLVGGQFEIVSSPSGGTTIRAQFRLPKMTNDETPKDEGGSNAE